MNDRTLIITCEHAVNTIPPAFIKLFEKDRSILETHRAIDIGAKETADHLARHLSCALYQSSHVSRLLIDCNRRLNSKSCFSEWSSALSSEEKQHLIEQYYHPFRTPVIEAIQYLIEKQKKKVLHLSIHSFTPILNNKERQTEIGILYDPQRILELNFSKQLKKALLSLTPHYRIRFNYPYLGTDDGFTSALRKKFSNEDYVGIEIEINQKLMISEHTKQATIKQLTEAIAIMVS
jgi:predicted N-formylglutamate amidohydrolase